MKDARAKFLTGSLFRHVTVMSLTASVGLMSLFLVDFVDMLFIAMLGKAELAAAIGYGGTILFFTTSFGIGMSIAAGALVARALGAGDRDLAQKRTASSLILGALFGAGFAGVVWWNLDPLLALIGASAETKRLAMQYLQIVVPSLPFLMIGMMGGAILRAHADARRAMMATIYGGLVNAALDPVLIFGLGLELRGAAIASVLARLTIATAAMLPIMRHYGGILWPSALGLIKDTRHVLAIAVPAILTQLATPVGLAFVTRSMAQFGEDAVAGMAIVGRLSPVAFGVIFALSGAVGPIIGQNFGAGDHARVRRGYLSALWFTAIVIVTVSAALYLLRAPIADLFGATGLARDLIFLFCGPLSLMFFFTGAMFVSNAAFNNLGHPFYSTFTNWGRNTVALVPLVWAGGALFGAPGVLVGQSLAGIVFGLWAMWLAQRIIAQGGRVAPESEFGRQGRLLALLHLRR